MESKKLQKKTRNLPHESGVYLFKDKKGQIVYIGKAQNLFNRVRSYFTGAPASAKLSILRKSIYDLDFVETPTEVDALLLEAHLVSKHAPRYNVRLKDDKSYPLLKITGDAYPLIQVTRKKDDRRARYYGPYTDAKLLREAIRIINTIFPIRKCRTLPKRACLYYHINQCLAPCIIPDIKPQYDELIAEINTFLAGGKKSLVEYLTERMTVASKKQRYEEAQMYKEQIQALCRLKRKRFDAKRPEKGIALSGMLELKRLLKLKRVPERIVCFDVSNIQGQMPVASKVSFHRELPDKAEYRRYKIKSVKGIDDYAMIREAVRRMIQGLREGREVFIPDLIVIDGGLGHLRTAVSVLEEEGYTDANIISLAKRLEEIYTVVSSKPIRLEKSSPGLRLLQKVRDEAHRFAITYHKLLRSRALRKSFLDDVPGIGRKRKQVLLRHFDSVEELRSTTLERLAVIPGMTRKAAGEVLKAVEDQS